MINDEVIQILREREANNAAFYGQRYAEWANQLKDPDDVLLEAEKYKRELKKKKKAKESKAVRS